MSSPAENALYRARLAFFVDSFFSKVLPHFWAGIRAASGEERDAAAEQLVDAIMKEVEPQLVEGKGPFFSGSEKLTFAEVFDSPTSEFISSSPLCQSNRFNRCYLGLSYSEFFPSVNPNTVSSVPSCPVSSTRRPSLSVGQRLRSVMGASTSFMMRRRWQRRLGPNSRLSLEFSCFSVSVTICLA